MAKTKKAIMLIVEDDEVLLRALYLAFHEGEYTIATATDGEVALNMAGRMKPDIILLDLLLPKMNGFDFLKNIKANDILKNIPVIVLFNLGDRESIMRAKDLGATDYFIKSNTDLTALRFHINEVLKNPNKSLAP